ncbi:MAG: DUF2309 domain-containing protein [Methylicorpusculum sp.]|uniref:YbcC family protein n=1 Tax=Methylicorpusculum sp. TaxID=2713644 RepID=UPI00272396AA|nr:DUF2309 domain-containing protein [Methylicorpusculum sp.]MDO8940828.1 DUF2309 domain-containing protein [Methylicorpusculum sp.]MDP2204408.1 DUF2309 domain-containing protein [Methylicorpusculum sp.]
MAYLEHRQTSLNKAGNYAKDKGFCLDEVINRIAHWLPTQGPLKDFIHHNTLHAVQHYPFHEGIAVAAKIFGARSYLALEDYQELYRQGRIGNNALDWAIAKFGSDQNPAQLRLDLFEADDRCHYPPLSLANHGLRSSWLTQLEIDLNAMVHPILFRLLANFLDQGISRWSLPKDGESFWNCVARLTQNSLVPLYPFNEPAARQLLNNTPDQVILSCLDKIVGQERYYEQYLLEILLAHPGWSGMVRMIELNPESLLTKRDISLQQLLAVELVCELACLNQKKARHWQNLSSVLSLDKIPLLADIVADPDVPVRLKIWHEAMEWALHAELLKALQTKPEASVTQEKTQPAVQALFCIDDRECSLRRYLEEISPAVETFGAAGFFGIDFLYQGIDDAYPVAQCPVAITPKHLIKESSLHQQPKNKSKSAPMPDLHFTPHSLLRGWLYTQTLGLGYAVRMAWSVFNPGSRLPNIRSLSELDSHSHLHLLRESDQTDEQGHLLGFTFSEMADRVGGLLRNIGLTQHYSPLVMVVAHGSSSVNNPHFAAYDCGACAGKPGAPNARAFAWMANHPSVRSILSERGLSIPDSTRFIAAMHNTSRDEITYFDLPDKGKPSVPGLHAFQQIMSKALQRNARERCRWFELGPKTPDNQIAHEHVIARASSIFEPRPELNHSNNLYCIVGRRSLTRDLFLDRRAFLHSYDPDSDAQGDVLVKIMSAIIPVCGGINLEYLFSRIDNSVYGAGTKLPHNVIGLLGVANGVEGDLRTGLPSQMIEVHEPARLLIVVEQSCEVIDQTLANLGELKEWLDNEWVRLVACHPVNRTLFRYSAEGWEAIDLESQKDVPEAVHSEPIIAGKTATIPVHRLIRRHA